MPSFGRCAAPRVGHTLMGMDLLTAGSLAVLALIDSTSFGTLLIPIWLLLTPGRVQVGRMLVYLATIVLCYFALGVGLTLGGRALGDQIGQWFDSPVLTWVKLAVGIALIVLSFRMDSKQARERGAGRLSRWRDRAMGTENADGSLLALMGLALGAVAVEVASMLPYLGAVSLLAGSDLTPYGIALALVCYCLVMVAPALLLLTLRLVARNAVEPVLERINGWLSRHAGSATSWVVFIVGVLVLRDALAGGVLVELLARFGVTTG